jgi:hypothetical protein
MALRAQWTAGRLQFYDGVDTGIGGKGIDFGKTNSSALLHGAGTSSSKVTTSTAGAKFLSYYLANSAASGDNRGMYLRLYLTGGGGGEAARIFTSLSSAAGTAHGAHISLNFSAGSQITGLGVAARCTLHIPNAASGSGTLAAVQAEIYSDGASSDPAGATMSAFRVVNDGNASGKADVDDDLYLFNFGGARDGKARSGSERRHHRWPR